jgi:hypothetical protein
MIRKLIIHKMLISRWATSPPTNLRHLLANRKNHPKRKISRNHPKRKISRNHLVCPQ